MANEPIQYYVYIGQLKKEFAKSKKAKQKNRNPDPNKFGLYVGYSSKPPKERWSQHLTKARNKKGRLYSKVAADWGENYIHWKKFEKYNPLKTIEDAAHAFGAEFKEEKIGNHSDFVMFSLQAIKHMTTVDGGLLLCKNREDYNRGKLLRWYGIDREQKRKDFRCEEDVIEYGYKYHMNDIAATIGIEQLKYIDDIVEKHIDNQKFYDQKLKGIKGVGLIPKNNKLKSSSWLYTIHIDERDLFIEWMSERKVMVSRVHERNDNHTAFIESATSLPNLERFNDTQISIPVGWWIDDDDRNYIANAIKEFSERVL